MAHAPPSTPSAHAPLGKATGRAAQREALERSIALEEARLAHSSGPGPAQERAARAAGLRLCALRALQPLAELPESTEPAGRATPGARERLVIDLCEHLASGGDRAALQARWPAALAAGNPGAAAHPDFALLAEGLESLPALAEALLDLARAARAKRLAPASSLGPLREALVALAPERWHGARAGVPAPWLAALLPARLEPGPFARLAAGCDAALDAAGRLRESQQSPCWELAALATVVYSRVCGALALYEDLSAA